MLRTLTPTNAPLLFKELENTYLQQSSPLIATILQKGELSKQDLQDLLQFKSTSGETCLHFAAFQSCTELAKLLLAQAKPGYINQVNANGISALHYAVYGDSLTHSKTHQLSSEEKQIFNETTRIPTIKCLLENTAEIVNVNQPNKSGKTPLHMSASRGFYAITGMLLLHEAKANAEDTNKDTPLHLAIKGGKITEDNIKLISLLAEATDADINARNKDEKTPLMLAYELERFDIIRTLMQHGTLPAIKTGMLADSFLKEHAAQSVQLFQEVFQQRNSVEEVNRLTETLNASSSSTRKAFFTHLLERFLDSVNQIAKLKLTGEKADKELTDQSLLALVISAIPAGTKNQYHDEFIDCFFKLAKNNKVSFDDRELLLQLAVNPAEVNVGMTPLQDKIPLSAHQDKINDSFTTIRREKIALFPLHHAIENGGWTKLPDIIASLAEETQSATLNKKRDSDNHTPLSLAISLGEWNAVLVLLKAGANSNLPTIRFEETLDKNILHLLIQDRRNHKLNAELYYDIIKTLHDKMQLMHLLQEESKAEGTPIEAVIKSHDTELVSPFLSYSNALPLFLDTAVTAGLPAMLEEIAEYLPTAKTLDHYRGDANETLLHIAAEHGLIKQMETLIKLGCDLNAITIAQETPIHRAAMHNQQDAIKLLVSKRANVLTPNREGKTFLEILIDQGTDVAALVKALPRSDFFPGGEDKKSHTRVTPTLLTHLFTRYSLANASSTNLHAIQALSAIAKLDPEGFYKVFKHESNRLREESNSGKITSENKLSLLKQHKQLCELMQNIEPALESLRQVKFHSFLKSPLPQKLKQEQKALTEKIDTLNRMISKLQEKSTPPKQIR